MYRLLSKEEMNEFIDKYFPIWKKDILKISCIDYNNKKEFLINEHYLFMI